MSDLNSQHNRVVWVDIPVADLDRAEQFYRQVLAIEISREQHGDTAFSLLQLGEGNSGCLVLAPEQVSGGRGLLVYMNVDGRIRDAVAQVAKNGGSVEQDVHAIGPYGCRAVVTDSEGNRLALHSTSDA